MLATAQDHGLAIATLMQTAQRDIVERERFSAKVDAGMTGARTTAAVLAGLPLLGVGLGELIGAEPVRFLLGPVGRCASLVVSHHCAASTNVAIRWGLHSTAQLRHCVASIRIWPLLAGRIRSEQRRRRSAAWDQQFP